MSSLNRPINLTYDSDDDNVDTAVLEFERFLHRSFENDTAHMPNAVSFPLMLTPVTAASTSEGEASMVCPVCLETRPSNHFYLFQCGHGVCKIEDFCKKYDLEHCAVCKRPRNIEDEVAKFSVFEEEEKRKTLERVFEEELKEAIMLSLKCDNEASTIDCDEGYVSSDSTITEEAEGSTVTLDENDSIATMTEWNVLVPRKKQRRV